MKIYKNKIINIGDLIPYANNSRTHSDEQVIQIASSIKEFGFTNPILIDESCGVIAGHGRILAAKKLDYKELPCIVLDGLTEAQKKAYVIADNQLALNSGWDMDMLKIEVEGLKELDFDVDLLGFDDGFLDDLLFEETEGLTDEDAVPEAPEEPKSKRGDIWILGNHRLMCGDSTMIDDVEKLMDGKKADMVFTDPPYNTGMTAEKQSSDNGGTLWKGKNKGGKARPSHMFDDSYSDSEWDQFMADFCLMYYSQMKENTGAYICLDWRRNFQLIPHIKNNFKLSNTIVWDKVVHGLGSDYKYTYELINVCKKGKPEMDTHQGDREYSDVWHIQRAMGKNKDHATAKPVEIVERCLRHASKPNSLVIDFFQGSGTTLIACEKMDRICYGLEMSENYIDVIIKRWQEYTGKEAVLESTGETYNKIT